MTEEDLKNIQAPDQKAPLTESQKRRNAFWVQMLGAVILLILGFIFVIALELGAAFFFGRVIKAEATIMKSVSPFAILGGILLAWFASRKICKALVLNTKIKDAVPDDVVDFYSGK